MSYMDSDLRAKVTINKMLYPWLHGLRSDGKVNVTISD